MKIFGFWHILLSLFIFSATSFYSLIKINEFYIAYTDTIVRQKDGFWLYEECQEPDFYRKLSQYSDACEQINLVFLKSPFTVGCETVLSSLAEGWNTYVLIALFLAAFLFILIPPYLSFLEKRRRERLDFTILSRQYNIRTKYSDHHTTLRQRQRREIINV
jgi:hypothetical protein